MVENNLGCPNRHQVEFVVLHRRVETWFPVQKREVEGPVLGPCIEDQGETKGVPASSGS